MKYDILDSVQVKRTRYELADDGCGQFVVVKRVGEKFEFLYSGNDYDLAYEFYEKLIGAR